MRAISFLLLVALGSVAHAEYRFGGLPLSGGTLTGNITAPAFISSTASPATSGVLELASGDQACWRNNAGNANACLSKDSSDVLTWPKAASIGTGGLTVTPATGNTALSLVGPSLGGSAGNIVHSASGVISWLVGPGYTSTNWYEITPSTAVNGSTFSNPLLKISNSGNVNIGNANLSSGTTITMGTNVDAGTNSVKANNIYLGNAANNMQFNVSGTAATTSAIATGATDGAMAFSGGTGTSNGGNLFCYGSTHASFPGRCQIRSGTTVIGTFDGSDFTEAAGDINLTVGNLKVNAAGKGIQIKEGSNAKMGTATLVGGTVTVSNTSVTANSRIFLTSNVDGGTPGWLRVSARTNSTSFVITSSSGTDTSTVDWLILEAN